jgi:hypothetical protein
MMHQGKNLMLSPMNNTQIINRKPSPLCSILQFTNLHQNIISTYKNRHDTLKQEMSHSFVTFCIVRVHEMW